MFLTVLNQKSLHQQPSIKKYSKSYPLKQSLTIRTYVIFLHFHILLSNYNFVLSMLYSNIRFNESPYRSAVLSSKNSLPAIENESTITIQHKKLRMLKNANCIFLFNHLI